MDTEDQIPTFRGAAPHCGGMFGSLPGLYPLGASSMSPSLVTKSVSRHWNCCRGRGARSRGQRTSSLSCEIRNKLIIKIQNHECSIEESSYVLGGECGKRQVFRWAQGHAGELWRLGGNLTGGKAMGRALNSHWTCSVRKGFQSVPIFVTQRQSTSITSMAYPAPWMLVLSLLSFYNHIIGTFKFPFALPNPTIVLY